MYIATKVRTVSVKLVSKLKELREFTLCKTAELGSLVSLFVNCLVGVLSPVNHKGLYQD